MVTRYYKRFCWAVKNLEPIRSHLERRELWDWVRAGKPGAAPHLIKQANLRTLQRRFSAPVLVETGTFRGDMMAAMSPYFERLYSIELSSALANYSQARCKTLQNVTVMQGPSEDVLPELCRKLSGTIVFWLDGHYSGGDTACGDTECPVPKELAVILGSRRIDPIIVIDDARHFTGRRGYPTVAKVVDLMSGSERTMHVNIVDDAIVAIVSDVLRDSQASPV